MLLRSIVLCLALAPPPWSISYSLSGGIAGLNRRLTLASDGQATAADLRTPGRQASFTATPAELAAVSAALAKADLSAPLPPANPRVSDAMYQTLQVTYGDKLYPKVAAAEITALLAPILNRGLKLAEDQRWQTTGAFDAGARWDVQIEVRDAQGIFHGEYWRGQWTRRPGVNTFDAVWRNTRTNEELRETVTLESAERGRVLLRRASSGQTMEGSYTAEDPLHLTGYLAPNPRWYWKAAIQPR